jgi:hypothetical protein
MAKKVNEQITDSVTQVNTKILAEVPAMAMGNLLTAVGQAMANASHNATSFQQHAAVTNQAATVQGVNSLSAIGSAVIGRSSEAIVEKG